MNRTINPMLSRRIVSTASRARRVVPIAHSLRTQSYHSLRSSAANSRWPETLFRYRPSILSVKPAQTRSLSTELRTAIDKAVKSAPVVLFMKGTPEMPQCGFSRASVQILSIQGVDPEKFVAFNVLEDSDLRTGIKEYSEWPTIPQLYINSEFVGGCDILMSMHQDGSLSKLLEEKAVVVPSEGGAEAGRPKSA